MIARVPFWMRWCVAAMVARVPFWARWRVAATVAACLLALASPARALDAPALERRVTDTAALLSADAREQLERRLAEYESATGHQFALLTIPSLQGDVLEDYAIRAAERWKLGSKERDDGLLVVIAKQERKMRIEVGHGLEGAVTDAFSSRVIRNVMTPAFRAGDFQGGIEKAFDALMKQASGEAVDPAVLAPAARPARRPPAGGGLPLGLIVAFFLLPALFALSSRGGGRRRRGGFFVGGLPIGWGAGSGSRRGGGFGGGGFGGGGFGGGGGGSFGGGGSSGSW